MGTRANRIIIERSMQPEVYQLLLKNIAGKDHERREQALKSLRFLSTTCKHGRHLMPNAIS